MSPATDWKEVVPQDESARFERYAEEIREMQRRRRADGKVSRGLHAKGQAGVEGQLEVLADLPEHARIGLFAKPAQYKCYVRFSNGTGARQADPKPDVRGVAIKVVGVEGKKTIPGMENESTQDFLGIRTPSLPVKNADEFLSLLRAASAKPIFFLPKLIGEVGFRHALAIVKKAVPGLSAPMTSFATTRYFSAAPIKFGPYAVHYALEPMTQPDASAKPGKTENYLGEELGARLRNGAITYELRVQFFLNEEKTPIEDASVEWLERDAPFLTVARLTLPQQDMGAAPGQKMSEWIETLSFDPWHALEEFRPLGNIMRARNAAYRLSTQERGAAKEPNGSERFD